MYDFELTSEEFLRFVVETIDWENIPSNEMMYFLNSREILRSRAQEEVNRRMAAGTHDKKVHTEALLSYLDEMQIRAESVGAYKSEVLMKLINKYLKKNIDIWPNELGENDELYAMVDREEYVGYLIFSSNAKMRTLVRDNGNWVPLNDMFFKDVEDEDLYDYPVGVNFIRYYDSVAATGVKVPYESI